MKLLEIEFLKIRHYRTFWVIVGLYFISMAITISSGMEFLKWIKSLFSDFGGDVDINRIPLYHFPDIWQNLIWVSGLFKLFLGIWVIISITNEYQYRTIRQNIIDGLSRRDFIVSKISLNAALSLFSMLIVGFICLIDGLIYSPEVMLEDVLSGLPFLAAYFLQTFSFLSFTMLLALFFRRSGLSILLLLFSGLIETLIISKVNNYSEAIIPYFPLESIENLINMPFARYALQEIQDTVSLTSVAIALVWAFLFNWFAFIRFKKMDI